jgi:hypothetical protein
MMIVEGTGARRRSKRQTTRRRDGARDGERDGERAETTTTTQTLLFRGLSLASFLINSKQKTAQQQKHT